MTHIDLNGIVIIVGNYGSGKTETTINLAFNRKAAGVDVRVADLDLVNPYFRTREARIPLAEKGIEVVLPHERYLNADLPILAPQVAGMIRQPSELTILDAGGDDAGVMVLSALGDHLKGVDLKMIQVINPHRPFTETVEGCIRIKEEIEATSRLSVTHIASNANLIDETTLDTVYQGYELIQEVSEKTGLGVAFVTAPHELVPMLDSKRFLCPVLPIIRRLTLPWKRASVYK